MKKIWRYFIAAVLFLGAVGTLIYYIIPSQAEQVAAIRSTSKTFLVITRDIFTEGLQPWQIRREQQGFDVVIKSFSVSPTTREIKQWIKQANRASGGPCRYIMLVGDSGGPDETDAPWHIPAFFGSLGYKYEEDEPARPIVSDAPYGDIDNDDQVEVAVGRLPVHTPEQLAVQISKIIRHEARLPDPDYYRAVLWTGGKHHHGAMYGITLQFMEHMLPDWLYPYFISSLPTSVCSGPLAEQPARFLEAMASPAYVSIVVGHGDYNNLRCVEQDGEELPLLVEQVQAMQSETPGGPLIMIACDAGSYYLPTEKGPSMAEAFVLNPGGPVAVIGAAGYINVVTNFYLTGSIARHIKKDDMTIGDLLVDSRQILYEVGKYTLKQIWEHDTRVHQLIGPPTEASMDLYTRKNLIREEGQLYNLMGDPSLAFKQPAPLAVDIRRDGNGRFLLSGSRPREATQLWVQHYDLNRFREQLPLGETNDALMRSKFREANRGPDLLAKPSFQGESWEIMLNLNSSELHFGNRIRVMATGGKKVFYRTLAMPLRTGGGETESK